VYPGYSPADHIYGEAAAEYGAIIAEARRQGKEIKSDPNGIEYVVGQNQRSAREQLEKLRKAFASEKARQSGETSKEAEREQGNGEPMEGVEQTADASPLFVVDSNPTPVHILQNKSDASFSKGKNKANDKAKRRISGSDEQVHTADEVAKDSHKKKKVKIENAEQGASESKPSVEEDDISEEVDRRLKEKEERRRRKAEKKRKRESGSLQMAVEGAANVRLSSFKLRSPKRKNTRRTGSWKKRNNWNWRRAKRRNPRRKTRKRGRVPTRAWKDANDGLGGDEKPKKKCMESMEATSSTESTGLETASTRMHS
jgi:hypothetical protein